MNKLTICSNVFLQVWNHTIALYLNYSYQIYESLFPQWNKKYKKVIATLSHRYNFFLQMWEKEFRLFRIASLYLAILRKKVRTANLTRNWEKFWLLWDLLWDLNLQWQEKSEMWDKMSQNLLFSKFSLSILKKSLNCEL